MSFGVWAGGKDNLWLFLVALSLLPGPGVRAESPLSFQHSIVLFCGQCWFYLSLSEGISVSSQEGFLSHCWSLSLEVWRSRRVWTAIMDDLAMSAKFGQCQAIWEGDNEIVEEELSFHNQRGGQEGVADESLHWRNLWVRITHNSMKILTLSRSLLFPYGQNNICRW